MTEKEQLRQMLEDVKFFFKKASDGLEMLAAKVDMIHQNVTTFNLYVCHSKYLQYWESWTGLKWLSASAHDRPVDV